MHVGSISRSPYNTYGRRAAPGGTRGPVLLLSNYAGLGNHPRMNRSTNPYERHRFPPAIIRYAVWLYRRFNLSHRDIEDLLAERGIEASYESVQLWCNKFGPLFSKRLKRRQPGFGDTFFIDEVFVTIAGH